MYLVDTNVWVEALLGQQKMKEASDFLKRAPSTGLALTDFALYSIGIILTNLERDDAYQKFLQDVLIENDVRVLRLSPPDLAEVPVVGRRFRLDFDDAYQYVAARSNGMKLVSFDSDFDRTDISRKTPRAVLDSPGEFESGSPGVHEPRAGYRVRKPRNKTRKRKHAKKK